MSALSRRHLLATSGLALLATSLAAPRIARAADAYKQPPLPFADTALAPTISAQTVQLHYGKHHASYYTALNRIVPNSAYAGMTVEQIVVKSAAAGAEGRAMFNQAGQAWNHEFYWLCLKPGGARQPSGKLAAAIDRDLGGFARFKETFAQRTTGIFGSGWGWLVEDNGKLAFEETSNADTPLARGKRVLATVDVWEHAYYVDYQNRRADHVKAVIDNLINWDFVRDRMA
jgi:superoxide dismutase, Fe-Mn family